MDRLFFWLMENRSLDTLSLERIVRANGSLSSEDMLPCGTTVGVFSLRHVLNAKKSRNFLDYKPPRNLLQLGHT